MACIFVGMALVVGVASYFGYKKLVSFRDQYTAARPVELPAVKYSRDDLEGMHGRIDQFLANAQSGETNARLALSANDLNALVSESWFSNRIYLSIESNVVSGKFSIPLAELGMPLLRGRFLNGTGTFDVGCGGGTLLVTLRNVAVNGVPLPDHYQKWIQKQNMAANMATNVVSQEALNRVGRIGVANERLVIEVEPEGAP